MKFVKYLLSLPLVFLVFCLFTIHITSCTKSKPGHDTTVTKDTTVIPPSYDITTGLVAYYNFNAGSLNDSSGNSNNIVFNNATKTADRFGNANNAYLFDGSSSYMQIANSASLNPSNGITMFEIIKINGFYTGPCANNYIIAKGDNVTVDGFYGIGFYDYAANCGTPDLDSESFGATYGDNEVQGQSADAGTDTVKLKTDFWYYVAYTYNGDTAKLYVNGQLKDLRTGIFPFHANNNDVFIGKLNSPSYPYYFNGVIDDVRIYNRALSAADVTQLSNLTN